MKRDRNIFREKSGPGPLLAIILVVVVSAVAFALELALADRLPWGEEARGVIAVLAGAVTALWVTFRQGSSLKELGFIRPRRWWTIWFSDKADRCSSSVPDESSLGTNQTH